MSFSRYLQRNLLDHVLKSSAFAEPANICVALYTSDPGETNTGSEAVGDGYTRVTHNLWTVATDASPSVSTNDGAIEFPAPGVGGWGTVTHFALFDATTGGNMLGYGALASSKTVDEGDYVMFKSGDLQITLD